LDKRKTRRQELFRKAVAELEEDEENRRIRRRSEEDSNWRLIDSLTSQENDDDFPMGRPVDFRPEGDGPYDQEYPSVGLEHLHSKGADLFELGFYHNRGPIYHGQYVLMEALSMPLWVEWGLLLLKPLLLGFIIEPFVWFNHYREAFDKLDYNDEDPVFLNASLKDYCMFRYQVTFYDFLTLGMYSLLGYGRMAEAAWVDSHLRRRPKKFYF